MALIELAYGHCSQCGHGLLVQVWWPMAAVIQRLAGLGGLPGLDDDDLTALYEAAQQADEFDRDDNGDLEPAYRLAGMAAGASVFVDGSREQAVTCPECGHLIGMVARQRVG